MDKTEKLGTCFLFQIDSEDHITPEQPTLLTGSRAGSIPFLFGSVTSLCFSRDEKLLIAGDAKGSVVSWFAHPETGKFMPHRVIETGDTSRICDVCFCGKNDDFLFYRHKPQRRQRFSK